MSDQPTDLTVSRVIKAPRSAVWRAWTEPKHFEQWWAPAPVKTKVLDMTLEAGGSFDTEMTLPDGTVMASKGCFLEVISQERIVFTDALQGGWRPNEEAFFSAVITLEEHPEGTLYTATALHKNDEDRQKHADMGFLDGWGTAIDQLGKLVEQLA